MHYQQHDTRPSMMEVTNQDRQNAVDAINDSDGKAGAMIRALNLVCAEQGLNYATLPAEVEVDETMVPNPKKTALSNEAQEGTPRCSQRRD